jgi:hypothetical protein
MKNCVFIKQNDIWICNTCGYQTEIENLNRNCKPILQKTNEPPNLLRKISNFTFAAAQHLFKGMPTVTEQELEERLEKCRGCELFKKKGMTGGVCTHENCGCNIQDEVVFLNKIAWADQKCPIDKWGEIEKK